jgi:hypothetical protein
MKTPDTLKEIETEIITDHLSAFLAWLDKEDFKICTYNSKHEWVPIKADSKNVIEVYLDESNKIKDIKIEKPKTPEIVNDIKQYRQMVRRIKKNQNINPDKMSIEELTAEIEKRKIVCKDLPLYDNSHGKGCERPGSECRECMIKYFELTT